MSVLQPRDRRRSKELVHADGRADSTALGAKEMRDALDAEGVEQGTSAIGNKAIEGEAEALTLASEPILFALLDHDVSPSRWVLGE